MLGLEIKIFFQYGIMIVAFFGQVTTLLIHIIRSIIGIVEGFFMLQGKHFSYLISKIQNLAQVFKDITHYKN